jgi:hypothetical protein
MAVIGSKKFWTRDHLKVIKFLVEVVKIDVTYNYEETLLASQHEEITRYLEKTLEKCGITAKKTVIDHENTLIRGNQ